MTLWQTSQLAETSLARLTTPNAALIMPVGNQAARSFSMGNIKELLDQEFQAEVLQAAEPVLIDFWALGVAPAG